jgi:hypothetical protein
MIRTLLRPLTINWWLLDDNDRAALFLTQLTLAPATSPALFGMQDHLIMLPVPLPQPGLQQLYTDSKKLLLLT